MCRTHAPQQGGVSLIEWVFAVDQDDEQTRQVLIKNVQGQPGVVVVTVVAELGYHVEGTCVAAWSALPRPRMRAKSLLPLSSDNEHKYLSSSV